MEKGLAIVILLAISSYAISCTSSKSAYAPPKPQPRSKYYTTSFPNKDVSEHLKDAQKSILRIVSSKVYNTYSFSERYVTLADIRTNNPKDIATDYFSSEESTAGTSILLEYSRTRALLITCDHIVSSPDTVISYYESENLPTDTYIKSISIKQRQNNLIFAPQEIRNFDIEATDSRADLALLTATFSQKTRLQIHPLKFAKGNDELLQNGSFLYITGFPKGYLMVTRGLSSVSESRNSRFFVTDAVFNPGISGGLVIASNNNFQSFQWVGMARSATASTEDVLVPVPDPQGYDKAARPYRDSVFVQQKARISYGITQAIPINLIKDFLEDNRRTISHNGFFYSNNP